MPHADSSKWQIPEEDYERLKRRFSQLGLLALDMTWQQWWTFIEETYPDGPLPPWLPTWDKARLKEMHHLINHRDSQYKGELER